jgi:hypothetical protein
MTVTADQSPVNHTPIPTPLERIRTQIEHEQSRARQIALLARSREQNATMSAKVKRHYLDARALEIMLEHINPSNVTSVRTMVLSDRFAHDPSLFLAAFNGGHLVAAVVNTRYLEPVSRDDARDWVAAFDCTSNTITYTGEEIR